MLLSTPCLATGSLDTDARASPTLEKVVANVAIEEITTVLWEVSSTQLQHSETPELSGSADAPATVELALLLGIWLLPRPWFQVPALTLGPAGDGPRLFAYAGSAVPSVRPSPPVTSLPTSELAWSQGRWRNIASRLTTPSSGSGVLQASSPMLDLKGPLSTLPWCEQVDRKEQEAVASATAPAAITSELLTASQSWCHSAPG